MQRSRDLCKNIMLECHIPWLDLVVHVVSVPRETSLVSLVFEEERIHVQKRDLFLAIKAGNDVLCMIFIFFCALVNSRQLGNSLLRISSLLVG